jgi:DHA1 family inner membrane transport protein
LMAAKRPRVLAIIFLTLLGMAACYTPYAYSLSLVRELGISESYVTAMLVFYGVGAIVGNLLSGYGTDKRSSYSVLTANYVVMIATFLLFAWMLEQHVVSITLASFAMLAWGATSWAQTPAQQHRLIQTSPSEAPLVVALNSSCIYFGIALGSFLGGITLHRGIELMIVTAIMLAIVALCYLHWTER